MKPADSDTQPRTGPGTFTVADHAGGSERALLRDRQEVPERLDLHSGTIRSPYRCDKNDRIVDNNPGEAEDRKHAQYRKIRAPQKMAQHGAYKT